MAVKRKIELLAPAGSLEKMKYAIHYGADAVYCGLPDISMRARVNSFTESDLKDAVKYVHGRKKKIFVTVNIYAHNSHLSKIEKHLKFLSNLGIDGLIISDFGILELAKKNLPGVDIHISTQANVTNWRAAKFWHDLGAKRVVLAREVTLEDIKEIHKKVPKLELEYFVHGAMCMSYSGRCILSKWMSGKSANLGDCSQPCRWTYGAGKKDDVLTMSIGDARGEYEVELEEDLHGTYFFNSKDLNLIGHLKELSEAGVTSFKIEGRNKSVSYVSSVVRAYRRVVDAIEKGKNKKEVAVISKRQEKELAMIMNRGYTKGFLLGNEPEHNFFRSHESTPLQFVGEIVQKGELIRVKVHNAIRKGDALEVFGKDGDAGVSVGKILNEDMKEVSSAHGGQDRYFYLELKGVSKKYAKIVEPMSLLRKRVD